MSANGANYVSGITSLANGAGSLASNYLLPSLTAYSTNNTATINPYAGLVTLTANSLSSTYSGLVQTASGFSATGLLGTDASNVATTMAGYSASVSATNAGTYTNSMTGSNTNANYNNVAVATGSLTIGRATVSISASKTYDTTASLNSSQVAINGVNGEVLAYTGTALANNANVSANGSNFVTGIVLANGTGSLASNYLLPDCTVQQQQCHGQRLQRAGNPDRQQFDLNVFWSGSDG